MPNARLKLFAPLPVAVAAVLAVGGVSGASGSVAGSPVAAFPSPGSHFATPATQIALRGVSPAAVGAVTVTGSKSGAHAGRLAADSDGAGASFLPAKPFTAGETVTVATGLDILGGAGGRYSFTVATPGPALPRSPALAAKGAVQSFHSRPDLHPTAVAVSGRSATPGLIFTDPQNGPAQNGGLILDGTGQVVYFKPTGIADGISDFRVQSLGGRPVLTYWQGHDVGTGLGIGVDQIVDTQYRPVATVRAANGLSNDLHEFDITPQGTALVLAISPVMTDERAVGGSRRGEVVDSVVQEIDIPTGLVLFEWHSLDHVGLAETFQPKKPKPTVAYDYFHVNSAGVDPDGTIIISARNTSTIHKLDHRTGAVMWTVGGRHSSFRMGPATGFAFQHDARIQSDGTLTLFDDGALPPVHKESRALTLRLDTAKMTATVAAQYVHKPALLAGYEGNHQVLPNGDTFVGWGQQPFFTEFDSRGRTVFDLHFLAASSSYRGYRLPWSAQPAAPPAVAAAHGSRGITQVWASWNGATEVAGWQVLTGPSATALTVHRTVVKRTGFETALAVHGGPYIAVQAVAADGHVLGTSRTVKAA